MKKDKFKIFILELLLLIILFFTLFAPNMTSRILLAFILLTYMIISSKLLKRRKISSINKKQVNLLMLMFALIYLGVFYLMGLYFGFEKSKITLSMWTFLNFIIPLTIIIVSSEIIRNVFLSQDLKINIKSKKIDISLLLTYLMMVLIDLEIYIGMYNLTNYDDYLAAIGFSLFASLSCNLLYNYISLRYDSKGIIIYRIITTLFIYIIPITPDIYIFFRSFLRMLYPYLIYLVLEKLYSKNDYAVSYSVKQANVIGNTILIIIMTLLIMLISCQFKYGILVIGSRSMSGTINKGDAIIFEKFDNQIIENGQIIIFEYNKTQTIHRVVKILNVNGENRYYTKGDNNKNADEGYRTKRDISGLVKMKVKYIGYPTIWLKETFQKE